MEVKNYTSSLVDDISKLSITNQQKSNTKPNTYLKGLPVLYMNKGVIVSGAAIGDDISEPLKCSWYNNLVRIATIGDGSCFIHAVLKGYFKPYQEDNRASARLNFVANLRRDFAIYLSYADENYPGQSIWSTTARGSFPRLLMQQLLNESSLGYLHIDYSLPGLQRLFNSYNNLGDEIYSFISDALQIDVYVLKITKEDIFPHSHTSHPNTRRNAVIIVGNMLHYEVLAINTPRGLQTLFPPNDPFLQVVKDKFIGDRDYEINSIPFDPDQEFIKSFVSTLIVDGELVRADLFTILPPTDPFTITLLRLWPEISLYISNNEGTSVMEELQNILNKAVEQKTISSETYNTIIVNIRNKVFIGGAHDIAEVLTSLFEDKFITDEQLSSMMFLHEHQELL